KRGFRIYVFFLTLFSALILAFKHEIFVLVCGEKIREFSLGMDIFEFTNFAFIIDALAFFGYLNVRIIRKSKYEAFASAINFLVTCVLIFILSRYLNLWGVVITKIVASFSLTFFLHYVSRDRIQYELFSAIFFLTLMLGGIKLLQFFDVDRLFQLFLHFIWVALISLAMVRYYILKTDLLLILQQSFEIFKSIFSKLGTR
ncbi:MAG: hypothetical protein NZM44_04905, partial [Candidatus Calescibacterium sp.]|nr:hypothetical protein [Candidatus Calescibacterium sp.]